MSHSSFKAHRFLGRVDVGGYSLARTWKQLVLKETASIYFGRIRGKVRGRIRTPMSFYHLSRDYQCSWDLHSIYGRRVDNCLSAFNNSLEASLSLC